MTLKAKKRFLDLEHVSEYGPMGRMALGAFVGDIRVFPGKWPDELSVTVKAQALLIQRYQSPGSLAAMGFVAVGTKHLPFRHGVPCSEGKFRSDTIVTPHALLVYLFTFKFLLGTFVQLVAVRTADLTKGVVAKGPVLHIRHGV